MFLPPPSSDLPFLTTSLHLYCKMSNPLPKDNMYDQNYGNWWCLFSGLWQYSGRIRRGAHWEKGSPTSTPAVSSHTVGSKKVVCWRKSPHHSLGHSQGQHKGNQHTKIESITKITFDPSPFSFLLFHHMTPSCCCLALSVTTHTWTYFT